MRAVRRRLRGLRFRYCDRTNGQGEGERGALTGARAFGLGGPPVELDDVFDEGQAKAQAARAPRGRAVALFLKRSKTRGRKAGSMPTPVSCTVSTTWEPWRRSSTRTVPPPGENFAVFESRFQIACRSRSGSAIKRQGSWGAWM